MFGENCQQIGVLADDCLVRAAADDPETRTGVEARRAIRQADEDRSAIGVARIHNATPRSRTGGYSKPYRRGLEVQDLISEPQIDVSGSGNVVRRTILVAASEHGRMLLVHDGADRNRRNRTRVAAAKCVRWLRGC